jgi:tetratricopeptide (TPR) repeat protein
MPRTGNMRKSLSSHRHLYFVVATMQVCLLNGALAWNLPTNVFGGSKYCSPSAVSIQRSVGPLHHAATQVASAESKNNPNGNPNQRKNKKVWKRNAIKDMFHTAKKMERQGKWGEASTMYERILAKAPEDSYSHLALARLEARRELKLRDHSINNSEIQIGNAMMLSKAQEAFVNGTTACPESVHLWQAWAVYEESRGNTDRARELFEEALKLDAHNPYVCHAFGLMEKKLNNEAKAIDLLKRALARNSTAALVCSLGEIFLEKSNTKAARELYAQNAPRLKKEKDKVEVYLAHAWLEERYFHDYDRAHELLNLALALSPGSSLANVALARLEGRIHRRSSKGDYSGNRVTAKRLAEVCDSIEKGTQLPSDPTDGRVFNALASIEVKSRRFHAARETLRRGVEMYPQDHAVSSFSFMFCF